MLCVLCCACCTSRPDFAIDKPSTGTLRYRRRHVGWATFCAQKLLTGTFFSGVRERNCPSSNLIFIINIYINRFAFEVTVLAETPRATPARSDLLCNASRRKRGQFVSRTVMCRLNFNLSLTRVACQCSGLYLRRSLLH